MEEVLREGYLGKRNRFSGVSLRWFTLTPTALSYADKEKGGREKGRISLGSLNKVEEKQEFGLGQGSSSSSSCLSLSSHYAPPFQVTYSLDNKTRTLYLQALDETDRDLWIEAIQLCLNGNKRKSLSTKSLDNLNANNNSGTVTSPPPLYHRGVWSISGKKWTCCGHPDKECVGCEPFSGTTSSAVALLLHNSPHHSSSSSSSSSSPVSHPNGSGSSHVRQSSASSSHSVLLLGSDSPPKIFPAPPPPRSLKSPSINQLNSLNNNSSPAPLSLKSVSHHNLLQGGQAANLVHTSGGRGLPPLKFPSPEKIHLHSNPLMASPEMASAAPPPPLTSIPAKDSGRRVVVALYPFKAIETGDLSLEKGEEYEICDDAQEHWWQVRDKNGTVGYIPSNYVKEKELLGLQKYDWYVGDMSRQRAETLLRYDDKEGCFVVRNSSTKGLYTLSLYTKVPHPQVKHYHIKQNARNEFYLSEKHCCSSIPDLINYHRHNSGGLASRLKHPPTAERCAPTTAGLSHDKWEIDPSELMLHEELGSGQFGVVRRGKWRGCIDVAVKMMKEGTMSEDDFIEEAKVMTKLQHQNLVQLYGVCSKHRPIYIVTEYMKHGALLNYLRRHETNLQSNMDMLLDICTQVCKGMAYLERHNYIHRDLAARNCLVGAENVVKVADFGLARYVLDDQYTSSGGTKFPIKWAPPEVLNYTRFSSKSDVWAYGVLMWEVFTCGKMPYGRLKNTEVVERVQRGIVLEKPKNCPKEVFETMKKCWALHPDERPSFRLLKEQLVTVAQLLLVD